MILTYQNQVLEKDRRSRHQGFYEVCVTVIEAALVILD